MRLRRGASLVIVAALGACRGPVALVTTDAGPMVDAELGRGPLDGVVEITVGQSYSCARRSSGHVVCWGFALGAPRVVPHMMTTVPVEVPGIADAVELASNGAIHTCARRATGAVVCWGENEHGQLGDGTITSRTTPMPVPGLEAVEIAGGGFQSCARRADGSVMCWGDNGGGQLGDGAAHAYMCTFDIGQHDCSDSPVQAVGVTDAVALTTGGLHTCVVRALGSVSCWGDNTLGALGDGTTMGHITAGPVLGLGGVDEIAAGRDHVCARRGGSVLCWGSNDLGQVGDGLHDASPRTSPVSVVGLDGALEISAGSWTTCARRATDVVCWGSNGIGMLGDGTTHATCAHSFPSGVSDDCSSTPVTVVGLDAPTQIAVGTYHACALLASGQVACWGNNTSGELGDGTTINRPTPVRVLAP